MPFSDSTSRGASPTDGPRFYCDVSRTRVTTPYVVVDREAVGLAPIAYFRHAGDAEAFRDLKRAEVGEQAPDHADEGWNPRADEATR
jgi:hypothetical protein